MVNLADVERPLALFAEGIAGAYCHLKVGDEDVADRGGVYLPASIDIFGDEALNAAMYRLRVLVQLGFREFGTFAFDIHRARAHIPALAALALPPVHRESDLTVFFNHFDSPPVARSLFHVIELARIEAQTLRRYPGARKYQEALDPHREAPVDFLRPVIDRVRAEDATVYDTAEAVVECYAMLAVDAEEAGSGPLPGQMEWAQREARLEDWERELDDAEAQLAAMEVDELVGGDEIKVGQGKGDGDVRDVGRDLVRARDDLQRQVDSERSALRHRFGDAPVDARSFLYDEWDYLNRTYRKGWCRLFEIDMDPATADDGADLMRSVRPYARAVRQRFEQIRPAGYQRVRKLADGDELDLGALVDARSDMRAGVSPDDRVYSRRERARRDVCAAFLVDLSASTDDPVEDPAGNPAGNPVGNPVAQGSTNGGAPPDLRDPWFDDDDTFEAKPPAAAEDRRIIDIQKEAVALMATALEGIGDEYGVYGFSGYGRDCVEFYVAKEFDEPFRRRALDAIAAMKPKRSTRMGPAIRHAAAKLAAAGAALKVMMIISDGFPQDCDYGPERGNHEYGLRDTAKALQEAERAGIHTFCITVDRSGHDYLRRMCPDARYMVIAETRGLPVALQKAYRRLTQI
ncbi:MAG: hypothetical protein OXT64_00335 [Gammaproteobacteria bacterium]|nr:hypothetical protein [Gammaproteobacteria bacterium]